LGGAAIGIQVSQAVREESELVRASSEFFGVQPVDELDLEHVQVILLNGSSKRAIPSLQRRKLK
jgi:hypothetical protein